MANIYCQNCGNKTSYQFSAPNFCSKCGTQYVGSAKFSPPSSLKNKIINRRAAATTPAPQDPEDDYDDDDGYDDDGYDEYKDDSSFSNVNSIPRISRIQVEIDASTDTKIFRIEDVSKTHEFQPPARKDISEID